MPQRIFTFIVVFLLIFLNVSPGQSVYTVTPDSTCLLSDAKAGQADIIFRGAANNSLQDFRCVKIVKKSDRLGDGTRKFLSRVRDLFNPFSCWTRSAIAQNEYRERETMRNELHYRGLRLMQASSIQKPAGAILDNPVSEDLYSRRLSFFCRQELELEKIISLPVRFRLGSLDYVNWLEQKPNALKPLF